MRRGRNGIEAANGRPRPACASARAVRASAGRSGEPPGRRDRTVRIRLADESDYTHPGKLDFVDNAIAQGSGTIKVRAIVPNPGGFIKPGMFGNLRLEASRAYPAMLVPAGAIVADASRRIVYVLGKDNTVEARPVELGPLTGNLRVIRSGLSQKDVVVISGAQRARPGLKVAPRQGRIVQEKAPPVSQNNEAAAASIALPAGEQ